jgi:signal peptidase I
LEMSPKMKSLWREWVRPLLVTALVLFSFRSAVADWNDVPSGSMRPTILEGDRIFVNKLAYDLKVPFTTVHLAQWGNPVPGDVVVLWSPHDGQRLVKRVVGVPGDLVEVRGQRLLINGQPVQYGPVPTEMAEALGLTGLSLPAGTVSAETLSGRTHPVMSQSNSGQGANVAPVRVPEDRYFVMGDCRDNSFDSRFFGLVERGRIVGRATAVVLSVDRDRHYRPRWGRFFTRLP